jgi:hypothetical protein
MKDPALEQEEQCTMQGVWVSVPPFENPYLHDSFLCNVECRQCDSEVRIDTKTHIHITE